MKEELIRLYNLLSLNPFDQVARKEAEDIQKRLGYPESSPNTFIVKKSFYISNSHGFEIVPIYSPIYGKLNFIEGTKIIHKDDRLFRLFSDVEDNCWASISDRELSKLLNQGYLERE